MVANNYSKSFSLPPQLAIARVSDRPRQWGPPWEHSQECSGTLLPGSSPHRYGTGWLSVFWYYRKPQFYYRNEFTIDSISPNVITLLMNWKGCGQHIIRSAVCCPSKESNQEQLNMNKNPQTVKAPVVQRTWLNNTWCLYLLSLHRSIRLWWPVNHMNSLLPEMNLHEHVYSNWSNVCHIRSMHNRYYMPLCTQLVYNYSWSFSVYHNK